MQPKLTIEVEQKESRFGTYGLLGYALFGIFLALTLFVTGLFNFLFGWLINIFNAFLPIVAIIGILYGIIKKKSGWAILSYILLFVVLILSCIFQIFFTQQILSHLHF